MDVLVLGDEVGFHYTPMGISVFRRRPTEPSYSSQDCGIVLPNIVPIFVSILTFYDAN
jgi:hypothetical protein